MSIRLHCAAVLTTCCASAMVGANGFSSNTCFPAFKACRAIGTCAGKLAVMSTASASTAARADSSVGKYRSGDRLRSCCARTSIPASMSTHATSSTSSLCCITLVAQFRPQPPIPTCTRRIVIALSFSLRLSLSLFRCRGRPAHRVGNHALYLRVMVRWKRLVPRADVEDSPLSAGIAAAAAKDFAAGKPAHKHQGLWLGDVEVLAIHLFALDLDVGAYPFHNRMSWGRHP